MRKITALLFCFFVYQVSHAQNGTPCAFETLFTFQPGMNKMMVMDSVYKTYDLTVVSREVERVPAYQGTNGDSIVRETIMYNIDKSTCLTGKGSKLQLMFADDKLYKAYISTAYYKNNHQQLISNFNSLRKNIKPHWAYETEVKVSGKNMLGFGFDYSRTKKTTAKTEKVTLQYIDLNTHDSRNPFLLEVIWVNLGNTRMQNSSY